MRISVDTKIYAVIGDPIAQSLSPQLHNGLFKEIGVDALYLPIAVKSEDLEKLVEGFRLMNFGGFNITKPHKIEIMKYLDRVDPLAEKIGAVNTVVCHDGEMVGYNTDGFGFIKSIESKIAKIPKEALTILILGCGGAVKSVAMALADWGIKKVIIANRTAEKAEELANQINESWPGKAQASGMTPDALKKAVAEAMVVVNGTSLGMADTAGSPLPKELMKKELLVYDMIYSPAVTQMMKDANEIGAQTQNGLDMLLYQGLLAFELWSGIFPDPAVGKKLLEEGMNTNEK
ncbi:shikimate dehydrogenase [Acetobacterium sp.]|jgi:shikimate dehydrogenase|uniref:shikimate dehydrogenase n=1 Tax=Acetobacterium sp. TaxID=1872094 RepID=UPI000CBD0CE6|nr:shikimate dehydrogenase [Acetobacterium sp.]MDO9493474.1 shikimate dehydrogenase [Acetobacterium sp.]PKM71754.1 MAG: shikimate dehydrogenase [Firmicutes bacterium HGW-Firmicutes-17]